MELFNPKSYPVHPVNPVYFNKRPKRFLTTPLVVSDWIRYHDRYEYKA